MMKKHFGLVYYRLELVRLQETFVMQRHPAVAYLHLVRLRTL